MDLKRIPTNICIREYRISFTYETLKGQYREQQRLIKQLTLEDAKSRFEEWAKTVRTMFKVEILNIEEIENNKEYIEL